MAKSKKKKMQSAPQMKETGAKKAAVIGTGSKSQLPLILAVACVVLVGAIAIAWHSSQADSGQPVQARFKAAQVKDSIELPATTFTDGKARHFEYEDGSMTIRFFVLKSSDGVIRAAFDACDVCWRAGKGYFQSGDVMVCRNCGQKFASTLINEVQGGCNPAPLNRSIRGDKVVIEVADIIEGGKYFNI